MARRRRRRGRGRRALRVATDHRGPLLARPGQQVERAELVHREDHRRITTLGLGFSLGDVVELQHPVLLRLVVGVIGLFEGLYGLKGHLLLSEQDPQALMADVVDHPLGDEELGQLGQAPGRKRQTVIGRAGQSDLVNLLRCGRVKVGGRPPAYFGYSDSKPSSLKLLITSRTRSGLVKVTLAIPATSMPCTDSSTICARRHVTTDPDDRRTIRNSRFPSSFETSRTRKPSLDTTTSESDTNKCPIRVRHQHAQMVDLQGQRWLMVLSTERSGIVPDEMWLFHRWRDLAT